jgi:large conductance mechanosensitive channel
VLKGFKDFIVRGNVIDLAVAFVVGAAFTALVAVFGEALINPIISVFGGDNTLGWGFEIVSGNEATFVDLGAIVTAAITFLITAAVVYFIFVAPMNTYREKFGPAEEEEEVADDVALLTEIRDLLAERGVGSNAEAEADKS